jgi:hypothetical protein
VRSRSTRPSLHDARPMLPGEVIPRAPSLHRGGRHQAHRPRLERGDAPARGTRRGSTEGMAPWRHLTAGLNPDVLVVDAGGLRQRTRQAELARVETLGAGERGDALPGVERVVQITWAAHAAQAVSGRDRQRSCGGRPPGALTAHAHACRRKANADGGGSLARRRIHGSRACPRVEHALQRSVVQSQAQRSPYETPSFWISVQARRSPAPTPCESHVGAADG